MGSAEFSRQPDCAPVCAAVENVIVALPVNGEPRRRQRRIIKRHFGPVLVPTGQGLENAVDGRALGYFWRVGLSVHERCDGEGLIVAGKGLRVAEGGFLPVASA